MPRLRHGARIDLTGEQVFAQRHVGGGEKQIGRGELLRGWSLGLLERSDHVRQVADWIVVEAHPVGVGGEDGSG